MSKFHEMRSGPQPSTAACFKYFPRAPIRARARSPEALQERGRRLLDEVAALKQQDYTTDLVTVTQYIQMRRHVDGLREPHKIFPLLMGLMDRISQFSSRRGAFPPGCPGGLAGDTAGAASRSRRRLQMFSLPDAALRRILDGGGKPALEFRLPALELHALERQQRRGISTWRWPTCSPDTPPAS